MRSLIDSDATRIIVFSRDEHKQFVMRKELTDERLRWFLGDVRDVSRLRRAFAGVDYVIHAAALKQVEACEYNPSEAAQTNVLGSQNVIEAAIDCAVKRTVLVSTDKAVNPSSLYGATKLCAERLFLAAESYVGHGQSTFAVLRCGNLAGSRGSVIPYWRGLIAAGAKEVPVTDPACTRYWMGAGTAVEAVWDALGGDERLYAPAMPAFAVGDLAKAMDMPMRVVGLSTGEKLHEEMGNGQSSATARRLTVAELRARLIEIRP